MINTTLMCRINRHACADKTSNSRDMPHLTLIILSILTLMALNSAQGDESSNNSSLDLADQNQANISNSSTLDDMHNLNSPDNQENRSENSSFHGPYNVHIYVSNKDDDSQDITLFIDSMLMETKSVSSDSDATYSTYPLPEGSHRFKITWWDEDVKKSFEAEETKDIQGETSVNLYTTLNDEPEKFDLSVKLTNENSKDLDAYLYVDDSYEKNKEVSKESTSDFGTLSLEEGVHNLSVRWQDKETKIEYEKRKRVTVSNDDVVVFYAPAGVSFDAVENTASSSNQISNDLASTDEEYSNDSSVIRESESKAESSNETTAETTNEAADETTNVSAEIPSESIPSSLSNVKTDSGSSSNYAYYDASETPAKTSYSGGGSSRSNALMDESNSLYVYAGLVILAVYLFFRH
jgi:hypothetical protein